MPKTWLGGVCLTLGFAATAPAQARPDTTRYIESVRATVTTRSGGSVRERRLFRDALYRFTTHGDTTKVFADSILLAEIEDAVRHDVDVDAVIGARWLMLGRRVVERPFVPQEIVEVSDLAVAMDDFLPPVPPALAVNRGVVGRGAEWRRLADSGTVARFRWTIDATRDSTYLVADSVPLRASEDRTESGTGTWSTNGRPISWHREITSQVTSTVRGRIVHAQVTQVITVHREP
ncbi:MAG: hypothetical protein ABIR59_10710 [Gemmatimonadales bacterium]